MEYKNVLTKKEDGLGWIIINRPDRLNALNAETIKELYQAFLSFEGDSEVKAVILTGSGEKAFVAGADIGELSRLDMSTGEKYVLEGQKLTIGLLNRVVPPEELSSTCEALAREIMANAPPALEYSIEAINKGLDQTMEEGLHLEAKLFGKACATEDSKEGTQAFLEKRKANFRGK